MTKDNEINRKEILKDMSPLAISNIMYAFSLLTFDSNKSEIKEELMPIHTALLDSMAYIKQFNHFTLAENEHVLTYVLTLKMLIPEYPFPDNKPLKLNKPSSKVPKFHDKVISSIDNALKKNKFEYTIKDEFSGFDGAYPLDWAIFSGNLFKYFFFIIHYYCISILINYLSLIFDFLLYLCLFRLSTPYIAERLYIL